MTSFRFARRIQLLTGAGIAISLYLVYHHVAVNSGTMTEPSLCAISESFDCDKVAKSRFASVFGIPVASFGLLYYLVFFFVVRYLTPQRGVLEQQYSSVTLVLALAALPPSAILLGLSSSRIDSFCLFCIMLYVINGALLWLTLTMPGHLARIGWRIIGGIRLIIGFLTHITRRGRLGRWARKAVFGTLLFGAIIYIAPQVLNATVFNKEKAAIASSQQSQMLVLLWKDAPELQIPVSLSADPYQSDFLYGPKDAEVTLVEFSDFECPFCRRAAPVLKTIVDENPGKVRLVFKNYPLDRSCNPVITRDFHQHACDAAAMVRCAGVVSVEKFWKMHDELFRYDSLSSDIEKAPERVGLDAEKTKHCTESSVVRARVREDVDVANELGVEGTPTVFINGKRVRQFNEEAIRTIVKSLVN